MREKLQVATQSTHCAYSLAGCIYHLSIPGWLGFLFSTPAPDVLLGEFIKANANYIFDHFWFRNPELVEQSTTEQI